LILQPRLSPKIILDVSEYCRSELDAAKSERQITRLISSEWLGKADECISITRLLDRIRAVDLQKKIQERRAKVEETSVRNSNQVGIVFDLELFAPLRRGMDIIENHLELPSDTTWMLILDEAEFLQREFMRIINSHLRSFSDNLFYKITTMPYTHTVETNTGVALDEGHDFEYIYIDQGPDGFFGVTNEDDPKFAELLFEKRLKASQLSPVPYSLRDLLGSSILLDPKPSAWTEDSEEMRRLRRFANEKTRNRAERLLSAEPEKFANEVSRKMHGALLLRDAVANA